MRHLVADNATDTTIVYSLVHIRIKERRLEDSCREANLVSCRVVVGIDSLRSHLPLCLVNRLIHLTSDIVLRHKFRDIAHILEQRERLVYIETAIVAPLVGITNLHDKVVELVLSLRLCSSRHPCRLVDALTKRNLQVLDKLKHHLLACCREVLLNIELADGLAEHTANKTCGTLPTRTILLNTRHNTAQLEVGLAEVVVEISRRSRHSVSLSVCLKVVERLFCKNLLHLMYWLNLTNIYVRECREALNKKVVAPVYSGEVLHKGIVCHLVVVALDVAHLHSALACLSQASLYAHCGVCLLLCSSLVVASQNQNLLQVLGISLAHRLNLSIVREIVVALAKTQSALSNTNEVICSVLHIGTNAYTEHSATDATCVKLGNHELILAAV